MAFEVVAQTSNVIFQRQTLGGEMAGALKEKQLAKQIFENLQAVSCPLVDGLYLQETDSMLELLCTPSQHRSDILAWICCSVNPNLTNLKASSLRHKDQDVLNKEMARLGQELMLCKADDLDLIVGRVDPWRQLQFLEVLLTLLSEKESAEHETNEDVLLDELFSEENLPHLTHMLNPTCDPWPAHIKALRKGHKSSFHRPSREEAADITALLQSTQSALEQLQSECEFLHGEAQSPSVFSPCALRVALSDLRQLMATFVHVYETDFRAYCDREPPSLSAETQIFQRVHQLLLACNTELEMLNELSEASETITDQVSKIQTQPRYWSRGEKCTLPDQLEELTKRYRDFLYLHHS
ncbi:HAUS augmin-like complex subunit 7 [Myripristis murdjan]|uniref:HAUS augmin-like complex subunit 7 n=1 Tax=Myripristis murdjan TaxID=586833 RepID=UPI001176074B|nr:HAUS augmin-like complex subunit 7 [Myripristis murdjan]